MKRQFSMVVGFRKRLQKMKLSHFRSPLPLIFLAALSAGAPRASAQWLLPDDTASYAILYEGSGNNHNLTVNTPPINNQYGTYTVNGNIGLGNLNSGTPNFAYGNGILV